MVKIDSPVSRRIVHSFLDFLKSVEPAPGVDLEGLEVVRECLEDVFKLDPSSVDEQTQPGLLVKHFSSLDSNKQHESRSGQEVTFQNASSTSSTRVAQASPSHTAKQQDEDCVGELHTSGVSKDELFGHFFAELDKIHFFSTTNDGADDSWLLDRATHLFHEAVKELERSGCQTVESLNLAETFKLQGNRAMQSKLYSDAIEFYTYAIALCQSNSVYYCNRAAAFTQIHKYIEAITDCKRSIEIDPNYSKAYSRLGLAYYAQGNYRDAIDKGFLKALQLDPNNSSVKENIRVAEQKLRDLRRTEQHQNGSSTNHSNQESTNGQARGGPRNHSVPSSVYTDMNFNPAGLPSDITRMFMNMVGQQHPQGTNDGTDIGSSDEPGIRLGGNFSVDIGEEMPVDLMGSLRAAMERFSGAGQPHQNSQGDGHSGPAPN